MQKFKKGDRVYIIADQIEATVIDVKIVNSIPEYAVSIDGIHQYKSLFDVNELIPAKSDDAVNHPSHYNSGNIEVIEYIEDKKFNFNLGCVVKYISRCDLKYGGTKSVEDLKKAKFYLEREIALRESSK